MFSFSFFVKRRRGKPPEGVVVSERAPLPPPLQTKAVKMSKTHQRMAYKGKRILSLNSVTVVPGAAYYNVCDLEKLQSHPRYKELLGGDMFVELPDAVTPLTQPAEVKEPTPEPVSIKVEVEE